MVKTKAVAILLLLVKSKLEHVGLTRKALAKGAVTVRCSNGSALDLIAHRFAIAASCCDNILGHVGRWSGAINVCPWVTGRRAEA